MSERRSHAGQFEGLFGVLPARYFCRFAENRQVHAFVDGVTAAATGAIAGTVAIGLVIRGLAP